MDPIGQDAQSFAQWNVETGTVFEDIRIDFYEFGEKMGQESIDLHFIEVVSQEVLEDFFHPELWIRIGILEMIEEIFD